MAYAKQISHVVAGLILSGCLVFAGGALHACEAGPGALGISRILEIETQSGPLFGRITKQVGEDNFLKPMEVVLTFDDASPPGKAGSGKAVGPPGTSTPPRTSGTKSQATASEPLSADVLREVALPAHKPAVRKVPSGDDMLPVRPPYSSP